MAEDSEEDDDVPISKLVTRLRQQQQQQRESHDEEEEESSSSANSDAKQEGEKEEAVAETADTPPPSPSTRTPPPSPTSAPSLQEPVPSLQQQPEKTTTTEKSSSKALEPAVKETKNEAAKVDETKRVSKQSQEKEEPKHVQQQQQHAPQESKAKPSDPNTKDDCGPENEPDNKGPTKEKEEELKGETQQEQSQPLPPDHRTPKAPATSGEATSGPKPQESAAMESHIPKPTTWVEDLPKKDEQEQHPPQPSKEPKNEDDAPTETKDEKEKEPSPTEQSPTTLLAVVESLSKKDDVENVASSLPNDSSIIQEDDTPTTKTTPEVKGHSQKPNKDRDDPPNVNVDDKQTTPLLPAEGKDEKQLSDTNDDKSGGGAPSSDPERMEVEAVEDPIPTKDAEGAPKDQQDNDVKVNDDKAIERTTVDKEDTLKTGTSVKKDDEPPPASRPLDPTEQPPEKKQKIGSVVSRSVTLRPPQRAPPKPIDMEELRDAFPQMAGISKKAASADKEKKGRSSKAKRRRAPKPLRIRINNGDGSQAKGTTSKSSSSRCDEMYGSAIASQESINQEDEETDLLLEQEFEDSLAFFSETHEDQDPDFIEFTRKKEKERCEDELARIDQEDEKGTREIETIVAGQLKEKQASADRNIERLRSKANTEEQRDLQKLLQLYNEKVASNQSKINQGVKLLTRRHQQEMHKAMLQHRQQAQQRGLPEQVANSEWTTTSQQLQAKHQNQMQEFNTKGEDVKKKCEADYVREQEKLRKHHEKRKRDMEHGMQKVLARMHSNFQQQRERHLQRHKDKMKKKREQVMSKVRIHHEASSTPKDNGKNSLDSSRAYQMQAAARAAAGLPPLETQTTTPSFTTTSPPIVPRTFKPPTVPIGTPVISRPPPPPQQQTASQFMPPPAAAAATMAPPEQPRVIPSAAPAIAEQARQKHPAKPKAQQEGAKKASSTTAAASALRPRGHPKKPKEKNAPKVKASESSSSKMQVGSSSTTESPTNASSRQARLPHGELGFESLATTTGNCWTELSDDRLAHYGSLAETAMKRYKREMDEYERNQSKKIRIEEEEKANRIQRGQAQALQEEQLLLADRQHRLESTNLETMPTAQGPASSQKKKVIRQQQQRLLLLRHASKCTAGPSCKTKFCAQMVALWKHMKKCRDKNCKTPHCLSSRCVLGHCKKCKDENKTSTCEVCAPVKRQITLLERSQSKALTRDQSSNSDLHQAGRASETQMQENADASLGPQKQHQIAEQVITSYATMSSPSVNDLTASSASDQVDDAMSSSSMIDLTASSASPKERSIIEILDDSDGEDDRKPAARVFSISSSEEDDCKPSSLDEPFEIDTDELPASCLAVAAALAASAAFSPAEKQHSLHDDHILAMALQNEEQDLSQKNKASEEKRMHDSTTGKAWKFVEKVLEVLVPVPNVSPVAVDDMVYTAERMLVAQKEFAAKNAPVHVDIGYHYTRQENLNNIRTDGLMSKQERDASNINTNYNGSVYGDGVYVASSPSAYPHYGVIGLMVGRLKGVESDSDKSFQTNNCVAVRKGTPNEFFVLQKSQQCVPLVQFASSMIDRSRNGHSGNKTVRDVHVKLQGVVDEFFNGGVATIEEPWPDRRAAFPPPSGTALQAAAATLLGPVGTAGPKTAQPHVAMPNASTPFTARSRSADSGGTSSSMQCETETLQYTAPPSLAVSDSIFWTMRQSTHSILSEECAICLDALSHHGKVARLISCGHLFHKSCIEDALLSHSQLCPTCRTPVGKPQGKMPSGSMSISKSRSSCRGHEPAGSIMIKYFIQGGTQLSYHPNPGQRHNSTTRTAFLPDTAEGNELLKRLKYAFLHGLSFTVGTSLTTGRPNTITWSSIHHKTSRSGGTHGFPDANYFANCNKELDALHIPPASEL